MIDWGRRVSRLASFLGAGLTSALLMGSFGCGQRQSPSDDIVAQGRDGRVAGMKRAGVSIEEQFLGRLAYRARLRLDFDVLNEDSVPLEVSAHSQCGCLEVLIPADRLVLAPGHTSVPVELLVHKLGNFVASLTLRSSDGRIFDGAIHARGIPGLEVKPSQLALESGEEGFVGSVDVYLASSSDVLTGWRGPAWVSTVEWQNSAIGEAAASTWAVKIVGRAPVGEGLVAGRVDLYTQFGHSGSVVLNAVHDDRPALRPVAGDVQGTLRRQILGPFRAGSFQEIRFDLTGWDAASRLAAIELGGSLSGGCCSAAIDDGQVVLSVRCSEAPARIAGPVVVRQASMGGVPCPSIDVGYLIVVWY